MYIHTLCVYNMIFNLVHSDLLYLLQKKKGKKKEDRLILNLGCPLDYSQYFR